MGDSVHSAQFPETNRYAGVVLFFGIAYEGTYSSAVSYSYSVTQIPDVEYKVTRSTAVSLGRRLISDTHGVKLFFVFSGNVCRFDFQTLLINAVAGLGLLSVATLSTDFLMEYLMPLKRAYTKYKYKETEAHDSMRRRLTKKELSELAVASSPGSALSGVQENDAHYTRLEAADDRCVRG